MLLINCEKIIRQFMLSIILLQPIFNENRLIILVKNIFNLLFSLLQFCYFIILHNSRSFNFL